jgi:RNA polymerase sigma-70 factor (ECF subfamily)
MSKTDRQFTVLVRETKSSVLIAISRTLKPDYGHMIDDVVQETYIRAYNSLKKNQFRYEASLNTWLYTIARNESLRLNAKLNKQKSIEQELDDSFLNFKSEKFVDNTAGFNADYKNHALGKLEIIKNIISQLPQKYKNVLELDILGFKDWQIAEKLKISLGTVKSRNSRAREKVRQWAHQMKLTG